MKMKVLSVFLASMLACSVMGGAVMAESASEASTQEAAAAEDLEAARKAADLIDKIYVQERTETTDEDCKAAKEAWDALTDAQKELVSGQYADPDYFGRDTGDAGADDPLNEDGIGENEILVVSFGTSFNDSRARDIGGIEKALQEAYPDWSVRRAFTAQIIINHVQARDGEYIDNMDQALERAVDNGVKNLIVQPTHLMHGAEYDELSEAVDRFADNFESVKVAEPLLGEVGSDAGALNEDKQKVAESVMAAAVEEAGYESLAKAAEAGYRKIILRPLMVVAGDHANNDMAGKDDPESWYNQFVNSGNFDSVECQIEGMGRIPDIEEIYIAHTGDVIGPEEASEAATENGQ